MEPKDLREFVKALHSVRVVIAKTEEPTKKRDLKAEAKEKKKQQSRLVLQFAVGEKPMALERLLSRLVTVEKDNKWLH